MGRKEEESKGAVGERREEESKRGAQRFIQDTISVECYTWNILGMVSISPRGGPENVHWTATCTLYIHIDN